MRRCAAASASLAGPRRGRDASGARGAARRPCTTRTRTGWWTRWRRFSETLVRDVMTPRPDIVAIACRRDGRRPAPADARDQVQPRPRLRREPRRHRRRRRACATCSTTRARRTSPSAARAPGATWCPETKKIAELLKEMQAPPHHVRGGDRRVRRHRGRRHASRTSSRSWSGEIKDEYDVEAEPHRGGARRRGAGGGPRRAWTGSSRRSRPSCRSTRRRRHRGRPGDRRLRPHPARRRAHRATAASTVEVVDAERKRVNRVRFRRAPVSSPSPA